MIAVIEIAGKQYKVSPKSQVQVDLLEGKAGDEITIDKVLLKADDDGKTCEIGTPYVGETLKATILDHAQGDKIRVFKFRPKTRFAKTKGHRQDYTILEIGDF